MNKPNCFECEHRGKVPGSAHSKCLHPDIVKPENLETIEIQVALASVGRMEPIIGAEVKNALRVEGDEFGIRKGWFQWPYNFDPVWLANCNGFIAKAKGA